jgi:mannitol-specific phosphotransferase system IIBC component
LPKDTKDEGGLYFDGREVTLACTAGTSVGAKLANAFAKCVEAPGAETVEIVANATAAVLQSTVAPVVVNRKRCKGRKCRKNKNKRCPSVQEIKEKLDLRWKVNNFYKFLIFLNILISDDLCILNELG